MKLKLGISKKSINKKIKFYPTPGNIRLSMGLYRTPKETEKYIQKSLKRKLP